MNLYLLQNILYQNQEKKDSIPTYCFPRLHILGPKKKIFEKGWEFETSVVSSLIGPHIQNACKSEQVFLNYYCFGFFLAFFLYFAEIFLFNVYCKHVPL